MATKKNNISNSAQEIDQSDKKPAKAKKKMSKTINPTELRSKAFEAIFEAAAEGAGRKVEAMIKGYSSPEKIAFGGYNAKSYQPDVVVHYKERTDIYAIEAESNKKAIARNLGKWILFSLEAKKGKGDFFIVTSESHYDSLHDIIAAKQIDARFITVDHLVQ